MSMPKMPEIPKVARPAPPVRVDDPELEAAREEQMRRYKIGGQLSTVLTPLNAPPPQTAMKMLLGQ